MYKRLVIAVILLFSTQSVQAASSWKWIADNVTTSGWFVTQGQAAVTISGDRLSAQLFDSEEPSFLRLTLNGKLTSGQVILTVTTHQSDVGGETMTGTYARNVYGKYPFEAIIVQNEWAFIALTRTLTK
jgi:outer membrane biogenesis lipoprotein LolB